MWFLIKNKFKLEYIALIVSVVIIHVMAVMSPGPDFFMTIRNSLTYSRKTGIYTAVGFGFGIGIHIIYCSIGLALIISKSILAFNIIKFLGAGYLIFIGVQSLLSKNGNIEVKDQAHKKEISSLKAIRIGFLTNVLNPKATLFFLSLFTFVIEPETPTYILILLGLIMMINTTLWFSLVAVFFTQQRIQRTFYKFQKIFNRVFGGVLILIGLKLLFTGSDS